MRPSKPRTSIESKSSYPGEVIHGKSDGQDVYIGNRRMARRAHCESGSIPEVEAMEGKAIGYIYTGTTLAGVFSLSDMCRSVVTEAVNELKSMGIRTMMLTGSVPEIDRLIGD
ncbi:unnamed protein product [Rhodiola kirilowii]